MRALRKTELKCLVHVEIFSGTIVGLSPVGPYLTGFGEETSAERVLHFSPQSHMSFRSISCAALSRTVTSVASSETKGPPHFA